MVFHTCFFSVLLVALLLKTRSLTLCSGDFHTFLLFHSYISFCCFYRLICNSVMFFEQQQQKRHLKMLRFFFQEVQMFNNPLGSVMSWMEKKEERQTPDTTWLNLEDTVLSEMSPSQKGSIVWSHWYEVPRAARFIETEGRNGGCQALREGKRGVTVSWGLSSRWGTWKSCGHSSGDSCTATWMQVMPLNHPLQKGQSGTFHFVYMLPQLKKNLNCHFQIFQSGNFRKSI